MFHQEEPGILRIASSEWLPFIKVEQQEDTVRICGPMANLFEMLSRYMPFWYTLFVPSDQNWGVDFPNGSWNGMIGMLQRNDRKKEWFAFFFQDNMQDLINDYFCIMEVDVALGPFAVTKDRSEVVDFSYPVMCTSNVIITARREETTSIFMFMSSFDWQVWVFLFIALLVIAGSDIILTAIMERPISMCSLFQLGSTFWKYTTILLQQGLSSTPITSWKRLLHSFWYLSVLVLISAFGGQLRSFLLLKSSSTLINNLENLLESDDIQPLVAEGSDFHALLRDSDEDSIYKKLYERVQKGSGFLLHSNLTSKVVLDLAEAGMYAPLLNYYTIRSTLSQRVAKVRRCNFHIGRDPIYSKPNAVAFRKGLSEEISKKLNKIISHIVESGLFKKWTDEMTRDFSYCMAQKETELMPLTIKDIAGVISLLASGYMLAGLVLLCEFLSNSRLIKNNYINT
ncbi:glutamate receptor ionotropic, delta-2-like [Tachypleus tridentatus]|uniref:glutamate receptor ionotropic, delta-2-like n=1 Tax=Tachypleus tridentatus TaxID=6853 RepID=UPI003FD3ECD0